MTRFPFSIWVLVISTALLGLNIDLESGHGFISPVAQNVDTKEVVAGGASLYGVGASPFGHFDCRSNPNTSACDPNEIVKEESLIDSLTKNLSRDLVNGNYAVMKEFISNVESCAEVPTEVPAAKVSTTTPENSEISEIIYLQLTSESIPNCDFKQVSRLVQEVKGSVFTAARGGNSGAQVAYGDLLEYELRTAVVSMIIHQKDSVKSSSSLSAALAKQSEIIMYAKSTITNSLSQQKLLKSVGDYNLEAFSLQ